MGLSGSYWTLPTGKPLEHLVSRNSRSLPLSPGINRKPLHIILRLTYMIISWGSLFPAGGYCFGLAPFFRPYRKRQSRPGISTNNQLDLDPCMFARDKQHRALRRVVRVLAATVRVHRLVATVRVIRLFYSFPLLLFTYKRLLPLCLRKLSDLHGRSDPRLDGPYAGPSRENMFILDDNRKRTSYHSHSRKRFTDNPMYPYRAPEPIIHLQDYGVAFCTSCKVASALNGWCH
jgi:hypothetical protein